MNATTILYGETNLTMNLQRSWQDLPNLQINGHGPPMWDLSVQILHWWFSHIKSDLPKQEIRVE